MWQTYRATRSSLIGFNPRQNSSQLIGRLKKTKEMQFDAPTSGRNNDWILVLDDADRQLPPVGNKLPKLHAGGPNSLSLRESSAIS